jgi:hypothetical protein
VDPVSDTLLRKSGSAWNRTRTFGSVARNSDHQTTKVGNQNLNQGETNRRLNSGNDCCHSIQNLLSPPLLSKNVKIGIYTTIILPLVLYRCKIWPQTLNIEHRLRVIEVFYSSTQRHYRRLIYYLY